MISFFKMIFEFFARLLVRPHISQPVLVTPQEPVVEAEPEIELPVGNVLRPADLPESNHYASKDRALLAKEYEYLWAICSVPEKWVDECARAANKAMINIDKYKYVEKMTKVPWYFVAAVHYREASQDFRTCLHNGDRLPGPTVHVPAGRGPFESWEDAAIDALTCEGFAGKSDWSLGTVFARLEAYNGFGYRTGRMQETTPLNASPYIYNGTQFYVKGRSIEDHSWYPDSVDDQLGCMAFLKELGIKF